MARTSLRLSGRPSTASTYFALGDKSRREKHVLHTLGRTTNGGGVTTGVLNVNEAALCGGLMRCKLGRRG